MTEVQPKAQPPARAHLRAASRRLCQRGIDPGLRAVLLDDRALARDDVLAQAEGFFRQLVELPSGPIQLELNSRSRILAGLLGAWAAEREVWLLPPGTSLPVAGPEVSQPLVVRDLGEEVAVSDQFRERLSAEIADECTLVRLVTSGTTGTPQVHRKTAAQILGEAELLVGLLGLSAESVVFPTVAAHHLYGLLFGILAPWLAGAALDDSQESQPGSFHPEAVARRMHAVGATHWIAVPPHVTTFAERGLALLGLREIVSSAAVLSTTSACRVEALTGARVRDVLGSTETGGIAWRRTSREEAWTTLGPVRISASPDGHLLVDSPFSSLPSSSATGDCIELLSATQFLHRGRDDGVVKVGGRRSSLADVERAALSLPHVTDAAAILERTDDLRGSRVWLFVAGETTPEQVRTGLSAQLERAFIPRRIRVLSALPRDDRGKLPRGAFSDLQHEVHQAPGPGLMRGATSWRARILVRVDSPRFIGHFAEEPVLPGVAQLIDWVVPGVRALTARTIAGISRLKFLQKIRPSDELDLTLTWRPCGSRIDVQLARDHQLVMSATLRLSPEVPEDTIGSPAQCLDR